MTPRTARAAVVAALTALACAACVAPATTTDAYVGKAAQTAEAALSSARSAVLAADTAQRDSLTAAALEVLLQESENSLASITATFDSIQPPDTPEDDELAHQLDALLTAASSDARWLRVAARRGDDVAARQRATSLADTADRLEDFAVEHGS